MSALATAFVSPTNGRMAGVRLPRLLGRFAMSSYIALVVLFLTVPVLVVILESFDTADYVQFPPSGITLKWYAVIWGSNTFRVAVANSIIVGLASTALAILLGLPAAYVLARRDFRGRNALFALLLSPLTVPWVVFGLAMLSFWSATGLPLSLLTIVIAHTVMGLPYVVRTCVAVLLGISPSFELAARTLGATRRRAFILVTLPMMRMAIIASAIFCLLISFINVPVPLFLTTASTLTIQVAIFSQMLSNTDPSVAAIATVQLGIILLAFYVGQRVAKLGDFLV
jgi:putative spermidine/putrescine transport system permease protein